MGRISSVFTILGLVRTCTASPIDKETYRELTDGSGSTGSCRGNGGGADRVDSRFTTLPTQQECETECTVDAGCVAYAYNSAVGYCVIYGPGEDGTCSLGAGNERYHNFQSCGDCSMGGTNMPDKLVKDLCGSCSKEIPVALTKSESICSTVDGVWTAEDWTAGTWEKAKEGWEGDSYTHMTLLGSTNVHTISVAAGYHCYDKVHSDGQPTCTGTFGNEESCQAAFEDKRTAADCIDGCVFYPRDGNHPPYCDGIASDGETSCIENFEAAEFFTDTSCTSIADTCSFLQAPVFVDPPVALHAPPADLGPGWQPEVIKATEASGDCTASTMAQCEGKTHIAGFAYGVCRADQAKLANGAHLNQKWCKDCLNTNGDQVNSNEEACAQACLDDPSGTCVAFSHADGGNCIIYGIDVDQYLFNPGDVENQWGGWTYKHEPCIGEKFPIGCEPINTIKPNVKFICRHLVMDNTRWLAWGDTSGSETITVELVVNAVHSGSVGADDFTDDMKTMLKEKMAKVAFVDATKDVTVEVTDGDLVGTTKVLFSIKSPSAAVIPMTGLLDTVLISKTRDGSFYFYNEVTGGSSNKNTGVMLPKQAKISGIIVTGMRHNLVDKSKEPHTRGWSDAHDFKACKVASSTKLPDPLPSPQTPNPPTPSPPTPVTPSDTSKDDESKSGATHVMTYCTYVMVATHIVLGISALLV